MAGESKKLGAVALWYREVKEFQSGPPPRNPLPHLSTGALIVTVLVGSFFVFRLAEAIAIIVGYGWHAYFVDGLRVGDWKRDLLSNGAYLSFLAKLVEMPATLVLMALLVFTTDFAAMLIRALAGRRAFLRAGLSVLGSAGLLLFARDLYRHGYPPIHPVPLSAVIGGAVLIWKALTSALRVYRPRSSR